MTEHLPFYAAAAVAAALLAYFFLSRSRGLNASPSKGSRFREFGEHLRLRDLYRLAVTMEEEGKAFYLKLGEKALDPKLKELCAGLAEEEALHRQLFQDKLNRWRPLGYNRLTWPVFLEKVKQEGFFENPPAETASEEEMAAYAIRQEIKTAEFYQLFEPAFPEAWKRERLQNLVSEERAHEARLRAAYPHLSLK